jgi:hypothetical protein
MNKKLWLLFPVFVGFYFATFLLLNMAFEHELKRKHFVFLIVGALAAASNMLIPTILKRLFKKNAKEQEQLV